MSLPSGPSLRGHVNDSAKVDSCLTRGDAHVVSGSEDGRVYFWQGVTASACFYANTIFFSDSRVVVVCSSVRVSFIDMSR